MRSLTTLAMTIALLATLAPTVAASADVHAEPRPCAGFLNVIFCALTELQCLALATAGQVRDECTGVAELHAFTNAQRPLGWISQTSRPA